ncbi:tRNA(Met) cytidine acetate ligase [Agathobacter rectalis]|uniref:tRNA(Met) cytidine acetate ligase n=1 Tax=Agathobacter rectalis TaxID=39491 RepID=UPI0027FDED21|nr:nucleotidyltransferase family protein [Agathobacter rectalis]
MKVAGVITEYNPFHNGHKYQLEQIKRQTSADYIVVAMSGNFVQRGEPAIIDKYERTRMALLSGADLVLELPSVFATASAEFFARGGVSVLKNTGVVDMLCYGVESVDHELTTLVAGVLKNPPAAYSASLARLIQGGMSFPAARSRALCEYFQDNYDSSSEKLDAFIASPNNILAIEYEKALMDCDITGFPIQRVGEGYHSTDSTCEFSSATAVRGVISTLIDTDKHNTITDTQLDNSGIFSKLSQLMPSDCADILVNCILGSHIVFPDDISDLLYYRLISERNVEYEKYADCTKELSAKITKNLYKYESFTQFCNLLKSKNLTYTRISRVLTHILLDIENDDFNICMDNPYLRILGFKKSSGELMHLLKKRASAPLITKVADAPYELISKDIFAADLYGRLCQSAYNEFTHGIVII